MTITVNIAEAKAQLSALIDRALAGEEVRIARRNVPLIELKAVNPAAAPQRRQIGLYEGLFEIPDSFFDLPDEEEMALWEGAGLDEHLKGTSLNPDAGTKK